MSGLRPFAPCVCSADRIQTRLGAFRGGGFAACAGIQLYTLLAIPKVNRGHDTAQLESSLQHPRQSAAYVKYPDRDGNDKRACVFSDS